MKATKRILALLMLALTLCLGLMGNGALAAVTQTRIFDRAGLFTSAQKETIANAIADFQKATKMDFVVVTSNEAHGDASQQAIADSFYDKGGFGLDTEHSGMLYYIDMYERQEYISTTGAMIDYLTDERISQALDQGYPLLHSGLYADAVLAQIAKATQFVKAGIPEGQYRYDILTGQQLTARHKALTSTEALVGAGLCLLIGLIFVGGVSARYRLKGSTYRYDYAANAEMDMKESRDDFIRTTVTRTRKAPPPGKSGGFGGGGGGSGVHIGGGGVSHGGGGRGF